MSPLIFPYVKVSTFVASFFPRKVLLSHRPSRAPTMRITTSACAQRRNEAALGTPRRGTAYWTRTLFFLRVLLVGIDDARDQRMAHHVLRAELREGDAAHAVEDAPRLDQAALLAARQVDLRDVAVHHRPRAEADAREE